MNDSHYEFPIDAKFLVTGGAGFIGSNLVEKILKLGFKVRVLDNLSSGNEENIKDFYKNSKFDFIQGDIRNIIDCQKACHGIDYVFHLAAVGSVSKSINDPIEVNDVNITGTLNMLIAARDKKVKRFIYASSSSVYGDEDNLFNTENKIGKPLSPYAITKITNELYAQNFFELFGLPTIGLRYFNVYGKKQNPFSIYSAVIPIFINTLLNRETPTIHGDGKQSRDFVFIEDIIQGNLKTCLAPKAAFGKVFNISYGNKVYIKDLYNKICNLLSVDIKPKYSHSRQGDIKHSVGDIKKAKKLLNYNPKYNIDLGLKETIDWYKKNLKCQKN